MASQGDSITVDAKPHAYTFVPSRTALLLLNVQRDSLLPCDDCIEHHARDPNTARSYTERTRILLETCRNLGLSIFHTTRGGHSSDALVSAARKAPQQADLPGSKRVPQIKDEGKMERLPVGRGHEHGLADELQPIPGEVVIDKPGSGAFWNTNLMHELKAYGVTHILLAGVTAYCSVSTTLREATDRGFECCIITDATAELNTSLKAESPELHSWANGHFRSVASFQDIIDALHLRDHPPPSVSETLPQKGVDWDGKLDIPSLKSAYRAGLSPVKLAEAIYSKIEAHEQVNPGSWIRLLPRSQVLSAARDLATRYPDRSRLPPLFGVPFTLKDSIDVAGMPTTTACPILSYIPAADSPIYAAVVSQGGLFIGKANLDQLATGLTGQRSPYGAPSSAVNTAYISGGSSSGSAVQVGAHLVSFSLGTDTAGSGRVPAAFNSVVGFKPTPGTVSLVRVTPACMSLDCIAVIATTVQDARTVWRVLEARDPRDPYSKPLEFRWSARPTRSPGPLVTHFRFGIPPVEALAVCSLPYRRLFDETVRRLQGMGGTLQVVDWTPFEKAGQLLYDGSFVLERLASIPDLPASGGLDAHAFLEKHRAELHPVISEIFTAVAARPTAATDVFRDLQAQRRYTAAVHNEVFTQSAGGIDVLVVPTAPTHWTVEEVRADPIGRNSALGVFTHCGNVLDLCAVSCPAAEFDASQLGGEGVLPFGVTFMGGSGQDCEVLDIAGRFEDAVRKGEHI